MSKTLHLSGTLHSQGPVDLNGLDGNLYYRIECPIDVKMVSFRAIELRYERGENWQGARPAPGFSRGFHEPLRPNTRWLMYLCSCSI